MHTSISRIQKIIDQLQDIVDIAEEKEVTAVKTCSNTYGLNEFVSLGSAGFLDLDCDVYDLFDDEED